MDSLTYSYFTSGNDYYDGQSINRLQQVEEKAGTTAYTLDFEGTSAYTYDAIGNLTSDDGEEIATIEWNTYGKVRKVIREEDSEKPDLEFWYDPMGNRLCKIVKPRPSGSATNQDAWTFTWYIRDAQGNIMATYNETHDSNRNAYLTANEFPMYGSTRLGIQKAYDTISQILYTSSTFDNDGFYSVSYGSETITLPDTNLVPYYPLYKQYELSNHLGNVLATISARPRLIYDENDDFLYKDADLTSVSDYYPYGMLAPERHWQSDEYRFGFNSQEKTDEIAGAGNHNTALFWEYDTRTGRRWNLDPKPTVGISDYACFGGNPIGYNDILGDIFDVTNDKAQGDVKNMTNKGNETYVKFDKVGNNYRARLDFGGMSPDEQAKLIDSDKGLSLINDLINATYTDDNGNKEDAKFLYSASNTVSYKDRKTGNIKTNVEGTEISDMLSALSVYSVTPKNIGLRGGAAGNEPITGYHGQVNIAPGGFLNTNTMRPVPRESVVFHELAECFYRTVHKMPYMLDDGSGAHQSSKDRQGNRWPDAPPTGDGVMFMPQISLDIMNFFK